MTSVLTSENILDTITHVDFAPADFLNHALTNLSTTAKQAKTQPNRTSFAELSLQAQSLLGQLNAEASRQSDLLTQLTDEIIRGSNRLAYEVEILQGETNSLTETLTHTLKNDIAVFGVTQTTTNNVVVMNEGLASSNNQAIEPVLIKDVNATEPDAIEQLRRLSRVRNNLDAVIKVFDQAMQWPLAPSETGSSLISVVAPTETAEAMSEREEKGRATANTLREGFITLLSSSADGANEEGIVKAGQRLEELRQMLEVWKGTAEEKARTRFVDGLAKMVDDAVEARERRMNRSTTTSQRRATESMHSPTKDLGREKGGGPTGSNNRVTSDGSYGFINSLRKMRGDI